MIDYMASAMQKRWGACMKRKAKSLGKKKRTKTMLKQHAKACWKTARGGSGKRKTTKRKTARRKVRKHRHRVGHRVRNL